MRQYLDLMGRILNEGNKRGDRTGTGTTSLFGPQMEFNLAEGFPIVTTKKVWFHAVAVELLWFLSGSTNVKYLQDNNVDIWDEWADKNGELGPVYGSQWRDWNGDGANKGIDQIKNVIERIRLKPECRRLIVSAWNVADIDRMKLPPCHSFFQFYVRNGFLDCKMYQRSADWFLGVPFNIASYALLTHMVAQVTCLKPGRFVHTFGDAHIYKNHEEQVKRQLLRTPKELPTLHLDPAVDHIDVFGLQDIKLDNYIHDKGIKAPIAV